MAKAYIVRTISNWNVHGDRAISAIVLKYSGNRKFSNKGNRAALTRVVKTMGFKTVIEYIKFCPGGFKMTSDIGKLMENSSPNTIESCFKNENRVLNFTLEAMYDDYTMWNMLAENSVIELFMCPTVEQIMSCRRFKKVPNEYLWFCSDWGDSA